MFPSFPYGKYCFQCQFLFSRCKLCLRYTAGNLNENPSLRALANILRAHEQASTRLSFASNSSKGQILRAFSNWMRSFDTSTSAKNPYHMRGKITERWLAEKEGIFFLITRALLVIKRAWLLDVDWLSTPALSWFPASNGFWKNFGKELKNASLLSFDLNAVVSTVTWKELNLQQRSLLVEKQKDFSDQKCIDSQPEKRFEWGPLVSHEA